MTPTQRVYQDAASEAVESAYFDYGQNRLVVRMATGLGKTVWLAALLRRPRIATWLAELPKRGAAMLVIAHRDELLTQARDKIQAANPGAMVSIEQGPLVANRFSDVIVASIQSLSKGNYKRLRRLMQQHTFRIVAVDECHHAPSRTYRTVLALLGFLPLADVAQTDGIEAATYAEVEAMTAALAGWDLVAPKDRQLIGLTATPNRSDAIGLAAVFQSIAYNYPLKEAIDDGWLVPILPWAIETSTSLDAVRTTAGEFNQKDLSTAVNTPERNRLALAAWRAHADGKPTLGFTVDVQHAVDVADVFRRDGVKAYALSGETPKDDRRRLLAAFLSRDITAIMNCQVLTEGTDLPLTECILHMKPTKSPTLFEQISGRGLRTHPDDPAGPDRLTAVANGEAMIKPHCILIDMVDIARKHSLQTAPVLYGLPPGLVTKGKDLRKVTEDLDALRAQHPDFDVDGALEHGRMTLEQLGAKATSFDVWTVPSMGDLAGVSTLEWIRTAADTFHLQYPWLDGAETLAVTPDLLGHFDISLTLRPQTGAIRQRTIAAQVESAAAALTIAEAFVTVERQSITKLKSLDAPWKNRPASIKQIQLLQRRQIPHAPKGLTMGRASQLIDLHNAQRGR